MKTFEIYECKECENVAKQIFGINKHIKNNNECKDYLIHHVKMMEIMKKKMLLKNINNVIFINLQKKLMYTYKFTERNLRIEIYH